MIATGKKPVLLFFPFDLFSHYLRCLQLAEAVKDQFEIYFVHSENYSEHIKRAGLKTFECESFDAAYVMQCAQKFDFSWLNKADIERVFNSQVNCIKTLQPAAVIGDTAPTLKIASQQTGTPYVSLMNGYMSKYYQYVRKIASAHPAAQFEEKLPENVFAKMVQMGERIAFRQVHKPFREIRRKNNLPRTKMYLDELEGDFNLICDLPQLFPQKKLPKTYCFIGPLYYDGAEQEDELNAFLTGSQPNILVSMGSSTDFEKIAFLAERDFNDWRIVIAGQANVPFKADHIRQKNFVNNAAILEKVDLMICHGGNGTVYQALSHGVPVLCLSNIFEQEWNVQRLSELGLGAQLNLNQDSRARKHQIESWLGKKQTGPFLQIKRSMAEQNPQDKFRQTVGTILERSLV